VGLGVILGVLDQYYDWEPDRPIREIGWTKIRCPNPDHDDATASSSISLEEARVVCFACGFRKDALQIVMEEEEVSRDDAIAILTEFDPVSASTILPRPAPRVARRRVFGDGEGVEPRRNRAVRSRVFR
jgi:hypothetical protein